MKKVGCVLWMTMLLVFSAGAGTLPDNAGHANRDTPQTTPQINSKEMIIRNVPERHPSWVGAGLIFSNVPIGFAAIESMSEHRYAGMQPHPPHLRPSGPKWGDNAYGFDAAGNALYCYVGTRTMSRLYGLAGFTPVQSTLIAGANIFLLHTFAKYQESRYFGAQPHDFFGAWSGISLAILQAIVPATERVQFKWFWYDTRKDKRNVNSWLEEYRPQKFYAAVRLGDLVVEKGFLRGVGVCYGGGLTADWGVRHYIGLDYDLRELVPGFFGEALNYLHVPLPALYFDRGWKVGLSI